MPRASGEAARTIKFPLIRPMPPHLAVAGLRLPQGRSANRPVLPSRKAGSGICAAAATVFYHSYLPTAELNTFMTDLDKAFHELFAVETADSAHQIDEIHQLRYEVYCLDKAFENAESFPDGRERDQYDAHSVHGLVRHQRSRRAIAGVRLVLSQPTHNPVAFPMEGLCLQALGTAGRNALRTVPRAQVAELSRFAVSRDFRRRLGESDTPSGASDRVRYIDQAGGQRSMPYITLGLFAAIVRLSQAQGITHWMAVMEPALLRLLQRFGIRFTHVGQTVEYHGRRKPVFDDAATVLAGIRQERPDVWEFITDHGRYTVQPEGARPRVTAVNA